MILTIWCGQVAAPKPSFNLALSRRLGDSPSGPADDEHRCRNASVAPFPELIGEIGAAQAVPALVQHDRDGAVRHHIGERDQFFDHALAGVARAAFPDFDDFDAAQPDLAAGLFRALQVALRELRFRALFQPADREQVTRMIEPR